MGKQTKVLHGSCSEVYINGQRDVLATKIEVKVTGDSRTARSAENTAPFPSTTATPLRGP